MASESLNIEVMLRAAFLRDELEFLKNEPPFVVVLSEAKTTADFLRLCDLGEELLWDAGRVNRSAAQFRSSRRPEIIGCQTGERRTEGGG